MKLKLFQADSGEWYFNITSRNGKIVCASEGYKRRAMAIKTIRKLFGSALTILGQLDALDAKK